MSSFKLAFMNEINALNENADPLTSNTDLKKFFSLIHILKGHEEFYLKDDGEIVSSNLEAVNITGYEEYEIIAKNISIFYLDTDRQQVHRDLAKAREKGTLVINGLKLKKRGITFWAKLKYVALNTSGKDVPSFRVTIQDITHRALSSMRVQTIKEEYLAIFNNPFVGSFKFRTKDYRIMMCNQKMLEITGYKASSLVTFKGLFHSPHQFEQLINLLETEKRVEGFKFLIRDKKGTEDNWAVISIRLFEEQGFAEGVLLDISEQHSQMMELQRVSAELDNFTYRASHDLRAPLTTIMGLANLGTVEKNSPDQQLQYFRMIKERIQHLDGLLKDLISVSFNNRSNTIYEIVNVREEVRTIIKDFEIPGHPIQTVIKVDKELVCATDPERLRTILRNLISNAYKYFNPFTSDPTVTVCIAIDPQRILVDIIDNGIGIALSVKERIYEMFYRGTVQSSGTGLGLYIAKSMVEKLKGEITFDSDEGSGSAFHVMIPNQILHMNSRNT